MYENEVKTRKWKEDLGDGGAAGSPAPPSDRFSTTGGQLAIKMVLPSSGLIGENLVRSLIRGASTASPNALQK